MNALNNFNNSILGRIKGNLTLQKIFNNVPSPSKFNTFKFNKVIQNKLNIGINDYKDYNKIIIEVFLMDGLHTHNFINFTSPSFIFF